MLPKIPFVSFHCSCANSYLHSFPTRRSSDLTRQFPYIWDELQLPVAYGTDRARAERILLEDRKSTRLNSSHRCISYAVFCLKKKKAAMFIPSWNKAACMPPSPIVVMPTKASS